MKTLAVKRDRSGRFLRKPDDPNKPKIRRLCPECLCDRRRVFLRWRMGGNFCFVIWPIYSRYDWWTCPECRERFVTDGPECNDPRLSAEQTDPGGPMPRR